MKVIKRDGSIVDYDSTKIVSAIEKANKEEWFGISISDDEKKGGDRILFYIHASDIDAMWDKLHTAERKLYKGT